MNSKINLKNKKAKFTYGFSSYNVKIGITAFNFEVIERAKEEIGKRLPITLSEISFEDSTHHFGIEYKNGEFQIIQNGETLIQFSDLDEIIIGLERRVFLTILEFNKSRVFIHSGAVSYKNKGIIFPANSYQGKSTLTAEFLKAGADYYSDDCAMLDENALLHPFAKPIAIREIEGEPDQTNYPVEHFGGRVGTKPVEIKLIVFTAYEKDFKWSPELLSPGKAVMEILRHTVPVKFNPEFTLNVLHKLVNRAIITKSKRGDAKLLTTSLLKLIDEID